MLRSLVTSLALFLPFGVAPARAEIPADLVAMEILPGWRTDRGTYMAGIRIRMAPGWKTYWRAPGDAGIPPLFDWAGSENVAAAAFHWPVPEVFRQSGMQSIGYVEEVVLPVEITPGPGAEVPRLAGSVELGICQEICVPVQMAFAADLVPEGRRDAAIAAALVDRPMTGAEAGLSAIVCSVTPAGRGASLTVRMDLPAVGPGEVVVIETADPEIWVSEAETTREDGRLTATADLIPARGVPIMLDRSRMRITVLADGRAVDIIGCPAG